MYLLDTDHLVILQRKSEPEYSALSNRLSQFGAIDFSISIVSFHEQILGAHTFISRATSTEKVLRGYQMLVKSFIDFHHFRVLPYDLPSATKYDQLRSSLRIGTMDLRIASTALTNNLTVLTRNTVDFQQVPGLQVQDWTLTQ